MGKHVLADLFFQTTNLTICYYYKINASPRVDKRTLIPSPMLFREHSMFRKHCKKLFKLVRILSVGSK